MRYVRFLLNNSRVKIGFQRKKKYGIPFSHILFFYTFFLQLLVSISCLHWLFLFKCLPNWTPILKNYIYLYIYVYISVFNELCEQFTISWVLFFLSQFNQTQAFFYPQMHRAYEMSSLLNAYAAVKGPDRMSVRGASRRFGVPFSTLNDRVCGRVATTCSKRGPPPMLGEVNETALADHLKRMSALGILSCIF